MSSYNYATGYTDGWGAGYRDGKTQGTVGTGLLLAAAVGFAMLGFNLLRDLPAPTAPVAPKSSSTVYIAIGDRGHCSGVYLGNNLVLTAAHCQGKDGEKLNVKTDKGLNSFAEKLWANEKRDFMLLKVSSFDDRVQTAHLACRKPVEGEEVVASGNPYAQKWIKTYGHVAGPDRPIDDQMETPLDITILPGMSGGPVFDKAGEVIGLNDALLPAPILGNTPFPSASVSGIGFMVPSYIVCELLSLGGV
jgi:serine protease Do